MIEDTLGDILTIRFEGNFAADMNKFSRINAFLRRPDVSPEDKWKADHYASKVGMGADCERPADYVEYYSDPENFSELDL